MIDTPNIWPLWKWPSKNLEDITDATKKEGIDSLSSNKKVILHSHLDGKEIAFRKNIEAFLEQAINKDQFNLGKITDYHIFTEWVSSVVARIATEDGKEFIFKSCNNVIAWWDNKAHIEAKSFDIRRKYWVKTPIVYQESIKKFNGKEIPYIIMEYIKPTRKLTKKNEQGIASEIGENIAKIAKSKGEWFWWIKKINKDIAVGEYDTVETYYDELETETIKNLTEKKLIGQKEKIKFHNAIQTIKNDFNSGTKAALNHGDIRLDNIFLTEPITILDPNTKLDHPVMDLATTVYYLYMRSPISRGEKDILKKSIWEWYEKITGKKIDKNIFNACLSIKIMQKIGVIYRYPDREKRIRKALELLEKIEIESMKP